MLKRLIIDNAQAIYHLDLELDPKVTTLTGPNGCGKSSTIRALRWLCLNVPQGKRIIRWGKKTAQVTLTLDDDTEITRSRGPSSNVYVLDGEEYKAMGTKVPEAVAAVLNIGTVNFQRQLDQPFWFSDTPGQVSKQLNAVVNLDVIDDAISFVATEGRRARAAVTVCRDRCREARESKRSLSYVRLFTADVQQLVNIKTRIDARASKIARVRLQLENAQSLTDTVSNVSQAKLDASETISACKTAQQSSDRAQRLRQLVSEADKLYTAVQMSIPNTSALEALIRLLDDLHERTTKLRSLVMRAEQTEEQLCETSRRLSQVTTRLAKFQKCPVCGASLSPHSC